jgi:hypothetical protein
MDLKCVRCIEEYIQLSDEEKASGEAWSKVRDADTMLPSWQQKDIGMGQLILTCIALPFCIKHIVKNDTSSHSGLVVPN